MKIDPKEIRERISATGLKVTPQRIAIYTAVLSMGNHPTAEKICEAIHKKHPNISTATVYNVLEALVAGGLIKKVKTDRDTMRYDAVAEKHHHIYLSDSDKIHDYTDSELDSLLEEYFRKKGIENFEIEDLRLQIVGRYLKTSRRDG